MGKKHPSGFTLVEVMIAVVVMLSVLAAIALIFKKAVETTQLVHSRTEVSGELRAGVNQISRDLNQAGTGIPLGGIPIPSVATGGVNPSFACDFTQCYLATNNSFTQGTLYKVTPSFNSGPATTETTDAIAMAYVDPSLNWTAYPTNVVADDGSTLTMPAATTPVLADPAVGLNVGDMLLLQNINGSAVGLVTTFNPATRVITFATLDPMNINQPAAPVGNIKALSFNPVPAAGPKYPPLTVSRIMLITYFLQQVNTPDGVDTRLMRQVGARAPVPVAEHIEDLKFTYDIFDDATGAATVNLPDAATGTPAVPKPNQIRKINITITARSLRPNTNGTLDRMTVSTSIGPRNLSFHDRYN
jgi:prepilin-type N-terminal cleavage/methylation domain-containing protein